jgi:hypothetical protein
MSGLHRDDERLQVGTATLDMIHHHSGAGIDRVYPG